MIDISLRAVNTAKLEHMGFDRKLESEAGEFERLWATKRVPKDVHGLRKSVVRLGRDTDARKDVIMLVCYS